MKGGDFGQGRLLRGRQARQLRFGFRQLPGRVVRRIGGPGCGFGWAVGREVGGYVAAVSLVEPLADQIGFLDKVQRGLRVHRPAMGSLVSQQANGVQFLENGRAYEVLEVGRLELFKQPIARLAGKPQVLEDDADEYFRKAA